VSARLVTIVTLLGALGFMGVAPRLALSPAPLTIGHAKVESDCLDCHSLARGVPTERCLACHPSDRILAAAASTDRVRTLRDLHRSPAARHCADCHSMHVGRDPALATHAFAHEALDAAARAACGSCHAAAAPNDDLHRTTGTACAPCHTTTAWRPAHFEHDRAFVLDRDHAVACSTCHTTPGRYRAYTCYGCHEHTLARIEREHREEGLTGRRLEACAECHRSASGHEGRGRGEHEGGHDD
jgi:Cytochrome c3